MLETAPTLLLDEVELLKGKNPSEATQTILAVLNAGHRKGDSIPRCEGPRQEVRHFRVFGATGGLEWFQEEPNQLHHSRLGHPAMVFERHGPGLKPDAMRASRVSIGHPEGYQEAFSVLYAEAAEAIVARRLGEKPDPAALNFATVEDGAHTMKFIDAAIESSRSGKWIDCKLAPL